MPQFVRMYKTDWKQELSMYYSRACASYQDFIDIGLQLTRKLLNQGFLRERIESSPRKFFGRHHDLVDRYEISISQMTMDIIRLS